MFLCPHQIFFNHVVGTHQRRQGVLRSDWFESFNKQSTHHARSPRIVCLPLPVTLPNDSARNENATHQLHPVRFTIQKHLFPCLSWQLVACKVRCRCDGGVCNNDFLVQLMSDLVNVPITRPSYTESTSLGAAFLAGLAAGFTSLHSNSSQHNPTSSSKFLCFAGIWQNKEQLRRLRTTERTFQPSESRAFRYDDVISEWSRAVKRCRDWHKDVDM